MANYLGRQRTIAELRSFLPVEPVSSKRIAPNTLEFKLANGTCGILFHKTVIAEVYPNGRMRLDTAKHQTATTKDRLNCLLPSGCSIGAERGKWFYFQRTADKVAKHPFTDGMVIDAEGTPVSS